MMLYAIIEPAVRKVERALPQNKPALYGGQAVIEGVMFSGKHVNVTAVRRKNDEIVFYEMPKTTKPWVKALIKIPFLRGIVGLIDSSAKGSQHLNFSIEQYAEDEAGENGKDGTDKDKKQEGSFWSLSMIFGVAVAGVISFVLGKLAFTVVPAAVEELLFGKSFDNIVLHNLIEGLIKIIFLLAYLYAISFTPLIKRLFQYHGAEHKVISCYEAGEELTVRNVQKYTRLHYRCGSSFIVLSVIVGVILYSMPIFEWNSIWERIYIRILLLPVVLGVSYEVLRLTNAVRDIPVLRFLGYPGLWLQLLTTKEPTDDQVAVSIASFNRMRELDAQLSERPGQAAVNA
jgi:Predicted metal-dependent enzyme